MAEKKISLNVYSQDGTKTSTMSVSPLIFGVELHEQVIYDAVRTYRNNLRQATAKTLTRSEVSGGGKKPWRQKGTGRARAGSSRSPIWVGGGNVFGPKGHQSFKIKQNRKEYALALKSALSQKVKVMKVLDTLELSAAKTKVMHEILTKLEAQRKVLVVVKELNDDLFLAARNLDYIIVATVDNINVYDLMDAHTIVITKEAVKALEEELI